MGLCFRESQVNRSRQNVTMKNDAIVTYGRQLRTVRLSMEEADQRGSIAMVLIEFKSNVGRSVFGIECCEGCCRCRQQQWWLKMNTKDHSCIHFIVALSWTGGRSAALCPRSQGRLLLFSGLCKGLSFTLKTPLCFRSITHPFVLVRP